MFTVSIVVDQVIDALKSYIQPFVESAEIIRGQVNRTPYPKGDFRGNFVLLTEIFHYEIETPTLIYNEFDKFVHVYNPIKIGIQADFYGDKSGDYINAFFSAFRSIYCYDQFPTGIKPLYCTDMIETGFQTGEMQYMRRWTTTVYIQYNPEVILPQDFPNELKTNLFINVDTEID